MQFFTCLQTLKSPYWRRPSIFSWGHGGPCSCRQNRSHSLPPFMFLEQNMPKPLSTQIHINFIVQGPRIYSTSFMGLSQRKQFIDFYNAYMDGDASCVETVGKGRNWRLLSKTLAILRFGFWFSFLRNDLIFFTIRITALQTCSTSTVFFPPRFRQILQTDIFFRSSVRWVRSEKNPGKLFQFRETRGNRFEREKWVLSRGLLEKMLWAPKSISDSFPFLQNVKGTGWKETSIFFIAWNSSNTLNSHYNYNDDQVM